MSNEARVNSELSIRSGNVDYTSQPASFTADITNVRGPSPGLVSAATAGTSVDLSALTTPALCRIQNLDSTNYVEFGVYSGATFYELGEILAGESYTIRLSRNLGTLRLKANTAACDMLVEAFDA
jgi:hypothetical protein